MGIVGIFTLLTGVLTYLLHPFDPPSMQAHIAAFKKAVSLSPRLGLHVSSSPYVNQTQGYNSLSEP